MSTLERLREWISRKVCKHSFALDDLTVANPHGVDDRVQWPCAKCGKVFRANYGLAISPRNGPTFQRSKHGKAVGDE